MGGGASRSVVTNALNEITAKSIVSALSTCENDLDISQSFKVNCMGGNILSPAETFENSPACATCYQSVVDRQITYYNMVRNTWGTSTARIPKSFADDVSYWSGQLESCKTACKACVFTDFDQSASVTYKTTCNISTEIVNDFLSSLSSNLDQSLTDNQDVLSSLAGVLGPSDRQKVVSQITERIKTRIDSTFINDMFNSINSYQSFTFNSTGSSTASGQSQSATISALTSLIADQKVNNLILSEAEWAQYQQLYNDENTIGALGDVVKNTTLSVAGVINDTVGLVLVIAVGVMIAALWGLSVYGLVKDLRRNK